METFFSKFPTIVYNGQQVVNITKSLKLAPTIFSNPFAFNDYSVTDSERSDIAASNIYNDPYMEWLVFLSNKQKDPYSWYMNYDQFYDYVNQKYGDWVVAQNKTMYYVNAWYQVANNPIIPAAFDALLPNQTKYYTPTYDAGGNVIEYQRTKVNWEVTTNHLVQCFFTNTVPLFIKDEFLNIAWDNGVTGNAQVAFSANNELYFQHVSGNYMPNSGIINPTYFQLHGQESNNTITVTNSNQISLNVIDVIDPTEDIFYDAVSYFDYENSLNEARKEIVVIDPGYADQIVNEFGNVFK